MKHPNFSEEKKLWKKGYKNIVCLDEAGRGALCGPVVAGAAMIKNPKSKIKNPKLSPLWRDPATAGQLKIKNLKDSKQLSANQREKFYDLITKNKNIKWGVGIVSEKIIDKINILEATKLAMVKAIEKIPNIKSQIPNKLQTLNSKPKIDYLILDGKIKLNLPIFQKSIIKGDEKVFSCALASIIAKVTRDRIMRKFHKKYPRYGFDKHKGYGTKSHFEMIKKYGPCPIHRKSFFPIKNFERVF